MARRRCCGVVDHLPACRHFVPEAVSNPQTTRITLDELEAVRLKDVRRLDQNQCAEAMELSRATFQRLLLSARTKIATALIDGNCLLFEGGHYIMENRVFECQDCSHRWEVEPCTAGGKHGYEIACPQCGSMKKFKINTMDGSQTACGGAHHGHGGGCCGGHH